MENVDLGGLEALPVDQTALIVNHFIVQIERFVEAFVWKAEEMLSSVDKRIQDVSTMLTLLEVKLGSIDGLKDVPIEKRDVNLEEPAIAPVEEDKTVMEPVESAEPVMLLKEDPRVSKYFTMLKLGVYPAQIEVELKLNGISPELLR